MTRTSARPHFGRRRADRTRRRILDASLQLFSNYGYERASMDDIALELEATKGLLYHYFRSKKDILTAILQEHPLRVAIEQFEQGVPATDLREALTIASILSLNMMRENRPFIRFVMLQMQSSREQAEVVLQEIIDRWTAAYEQMIRLYTRARRHSVAPLAARQLVDLILASFIRNELVGEPGEHLESYALEAVETVLSRISNET